MRNTVHENISTPKDSTELSETTMSDHVIHDTINPQSQDQNACVHESPVIDEVLKGGISNTMCIQLRGRATENPYSFDTSTEDNPAHCIAENTQWVAFSYTEWHIIARFL